MSDATSDTAGREEERTWATLATITTFDGETLNVDLDSSFTYVAALNKPARMNHEPNESFVWKASYSDEDASSGSERMLPIRTVEKLHRVLNSKGFIYLYVPAVFTRGSTELHGTFLNGETIKRVAISRQVRLSL